MQLCGSSPRLVDLLADLRRAERLGVPSWIVVAVRGCIGELEQLAASGSDAQTDALRAQAETLVQLCACLSSRVRRR